MRRRRRRVLVVAAGRHQERAGDAAIGAGGRRARLRASSRKQHAPPGLHWRQVVDLRLPAQILETPPVRPEVMLLRGRSRSLVPLAIAACTHARSRRVSLAGPSWYIVSALGVVVVLVLIRWARPA